MCEFFSKPPEKKPSKENATHDTNNQNKQIKPSDTAPQKSSNIDETNTMRPSLIDSAYLRSLSPCF